MPSKKRERKRGKSAAKMMEAAKKQVASTAIVKLAKPEKPKLSKAEADERTERLAQLAKQYHSIWCALGMEIARAVADGVPAATGLLFTDWTQKVFGDEWQKIRRAFLSYKALSHLPMEKLERISEGNAYVLRSLPEKTRKDPAWVKSAIDMPNEKFKEKAEKFLVKKTGLRDPMVKFPEAFGYSTLPKSLAKTVTNTLKLACKVNDFDWDQKEGRISATEAVFSEYFNENQAGANLGPKKAEEPEEEEIYDPEEEADLEEIEREEEEFRDK